MSKAIWHDLECGSYTADLMFWRALAEKVGGPVLDVGAGTGRTALALAQEGHAVVAIDHDDALLSELRDRAGNLEVMTIVADARAFWLGETFPLIIVPMQTIQLLGGAEGRAAFLECAAYHLAVTDISHRVAFDTCGHEVHRFEREPGELSLRIGVVKGSRLGKVTERAAAATEAKDEVPELSTGPAVPESVFVEPAHVSSDGRAGDNGRCERAVVSILDGASQRRFLIVDDRPIGDEAILSISCSHSRKADVAYLLPSHRERPQSRYHSDSAFRRIIERRSIFASSPISPSSLLIASWYELDSFAIP